MGDREIKKVVDSVLSCCSRRVGCRITHHVRRRLVRAESVAPQRRILQEIISSATAAVHAPRPLIGLVVHVQRRLHFFIIQYFAFARRFTGDAATLAHRHLVSRRNPLHAIPDDTELPFRSPRANQKSSTVLWVSSLAPGIGVPDHGPPAGRVGAAVLPHGDGAPDERAGDGGELPIQSIRAPSAAHPTHVSPPGSGDVPLAATCHDHPCPPAIGPLHPRRHDPDQRGGQTDQEEVPVPACGPVCVSRHFHHLRPRGAPREKAHGGEEHPVPDVQQSLHAEGQHEATRADAQIFAIGRLIADRVGQEAATLPGGIDVPAARHPFAIPLAVATGAPRIPIFLGHGYGSAPSASIRLSDRNVSFAPGPSNQQPPPRVPVTHGQHERSKRGRRRGRKSWVGCTCDSSERDD